jgi:hypothetical protein
MYGKSLGSEVSSLIWPGFVDAISCMVLNLLFLTTVLVISVFVLGQGQALYESELQAHQTAEMALLGYRAQDSQRASHPPDVLLCRSGYVSVSANLLSPAISTFPWRPSAPFPAPAIELNRESKGDVRVTEDAGAGALITLSFSSQIAVVPQERRAALVERMRAIEALNPGQSYEVRVATDTTLSDARRSAYVRAMSVRDVMQAAGIGPSLIKLRMVSDGPVGGDSLVHVYSSNE